jgi:hypothetical protein
LVVREDASEPGIIRGKAEESNDLPMMFVQQLLLVSSERSVIVLCEQQVKLDPQQHRELGRAGWLTGVRRCGIPLFIEQSERSLGVKCHKGEAFILKSLQWSVAKVTWPGARSCGAQNQVTQKYYYRNGTGPHALARRSKKAAQGAKIKQR